MLRFKATVCMRNFIIMLSKCATTHYFLNSSTSNLPLPNIILFQCETLTLALFNCSILQEGFFCSRISFFSLCACERETLKWCMTELRHKIIAVLILHLDNKINNLIFSYFSQIFII